MDSADSGSELSSKRLTQPRLRLHVSPTAEWKLRSGHPWLFSDSILEQNRPALTGELAVIYDRHDNFLGIGLYDPDSPIRVRVLHRGKPRSIAEAFWIERLREATQRRARLFDADTDGYRMIHGENDGWPGLVLDRYASTLVVKLYSGVWIPRLNEIAALLARELRPERLVLRLSRNMKVVARGTAFRDGQTLLGPAVDDIVVFKETGLSFEADVVRGQKTGFFLDQRENRRIVESLARNRVVLNMFSFSGGFSVYAARGGAASVTDVDISEHALESAKHNFRLNRDIAAVESCRHETVKADAFEWIKTTGEQQFDMVIVDPPSLAKRENERDRAIKAYATLAHHAVKRLKPDGLLVASSCSAHVSADEFFATVRQVARDSGRSHKELQTTRHPLDHPATFAEAHYLKTIYVAF
jgi:23S rRNA (cytosine1962-C5)-methyltransferase